MKDFIISKEMTIEDIRRIVNVLGYFESAEIELIALEYAGTRPMSKIDAEYLRSDLNRAKRELIGTLSACLNKIERGETF